MAIDSQQKRMAATGVGRPWMRANYPETPVTSAWRSSVGNSYPVAAFVSNFVEGARSWTIKARSVIWDTLTRGIGWDTEDRPITWTTPERDDT